MNCLFSVVVPIYQIEKYLEKCIQSILNQTYANFEVILVDDGSKDGSPLICDQYAQKDSRIIVIHKENGGLVSARKAGSDIAKGKYVVCVDGDDWIHEDYLAKMAKVIDKHNPDVICTDFYFAYEDHMTEAHTSYRNGFYNKTEIETEIFPSLICGKGCKSFPQSLWGKAFRSNIYKQQQQQMVSLRVIRGEDVACTYPIISKADSLYVMTDCLYYYRQNPTSITKVKKAYPWNGPQLIGEMLINTINDECFDFKEQIDWCVVNELFNVAASQFHAGQAFFKTRKEIADRLKTPYYRELLSKCHIRGNLRDIIVVATLKLRLGLVLKGYAKAKL